jgi:gliding motility-associated-like protein
MVEVVSTDNCKATDTMTVHVERNDELLVPNIFSPNGDGINDVLLISTASGIEEIIAFEIFDRWGNLMHGRYNLPAHDDSHAWNGKRDEQYAQSGVYAYRLIVKHKHGEVIAASGDITLMR